MADIAIHWGQLSNCRPLLALVPGYYQSKPGYIVDHGLSFLFWQLSRFSEGSFSSNHFAIQVYDPFFHFYFPIAVYMVKEKKKKPVHVYFLFEYPADYFNNR